MSSIKKAKEKKEEPVSPFAILILYSLLLRGFAPLLLCVKKMNFTKRTHSQKSQPLIYQHDMKKPCHSGTQNEPITNPFLGRANPL
jgi:hypothetical protein